MNKKGIIGFDAGYGFIKTVFSDNESAQWDSRIFPALFTENPPKYEKLLGWKGEDPFSPNFDEDFVFEMDGKKYAVGKSIKDMTMHFANEDFSLNRDIERLKGWLLSVITMLAVTKGIEHFVVGWTVPVNFEDREIERIKSGHIKGKHTVSMIGDTTGKITKEIEIDKIYIVEQGVATVIDQSTIINDKEITVDSSFDNKKIIIIDIGTNTINKIFIDSMQVKEKQRNLETGALAAITEIRKELSKMGFDFSIQEIQENFFMKNNFFAAKMINGIFQRTNLKPVVDKVIEQSFKKTIEPAIDLFISNILNKNKDVDEIIYTGGGVKLFESFLQDLSKYSTKIIVPKYPQLTNALGAWKAAYYRMI